MSWELHRHDARHISELLAPESVDLIVTSPPYFALRSYRDGGEHYDGQVGSEATPTEFVDNLIACTADWLKVLKPSGSLWVNLGDKYAGSGGHNNSSLGSTPLYSKSTLTGGKRKLVAQETDRINATRRNAPDRYNQNSDGIPAKSLMGLPWRYALRCIDELGLILRAEIIWSKPNGLPESVTDRIRRSHEQWFHFTRQGRYFAAIDEVREATDNSRGGPNGPGHVLANADIHQGDYGNHDRATVTQTRKWDPANREYNPLGKAPGSVWSIPSEPLDVPAHLGVDHFAAFPSELPRRIILGWSPTGYCTTCGEPRRAVVDKQLEVLGIKQTMKRQWQDLNDDGRRDTGMGAGVMGVNHTTIIGYACACPTPDAPTRPAVVLDPFCGTGTVPAVAHLLGRHGIGTDLSNDYLRLAEWRCSSDRALRDKVLDRSGIPNPDPPKIVGQLALFGEVVS